MHDVKYAWYVTSKGYKIVDGTASQFLKADGSVDSNKYVPHTGATAPVNLGATNELKAKEFDAIGAYVENPNTNRNYEFVKLNGSTIGVYQAQVWNGSAWVDSVSNGFGHYALQYNTGVYSNGFGYSALRYNTGSNSNGFGYLSLQYNTGANSNGFGYISLLYNTGANSNGFGHYALRYNTGVNSNGFGYYALQNNTGSNSNGFGYLSLQYNTGANSNGFGYISLLYNTGANSNGFGYASLRYNTGSNNNVLGHYSFADFYADTVNAKLFDATAIDMVAKTITIPNHGFGTNGTYTNLRFVQGDSPITGLSNGIIVQVKIIDANTIAFEEVIQSGQVRRNVLITNAGTGIGHKFEPQKSLTNINILGASINPTKSNQTIFAGGEAILPQSTVATIDADATNKALITKEWYNSKVNASLSNYYTKSEAVNMFVGLNGVQTIGGTKTFNESPIVPTPTLSTHAVNKSYVDVQLGSYMPTNAVTTNTVQYVTEKKYFENQYPFVFNDPTEVTVRFAFHKSPSVNSIFLVPSTDADTDNWDWTKQIEFKDNGKIKCNGFEVVGKDDSYIVKAGGGTEKADNFRDGLLVINNNIKVLADSTNKTTNVIVNGTGSSRLTIGSAANNMGHTINIYKTQDSTNSFELICGGSTLGAWGSNVGLRMISDGVNWIGVTDINSIEIW